MMPRAYPYTRLMIQASYSLVVLIRALYEAYMGTGAHLLTTLVGMSLRKRQWLAGGARFIWYRIRSTNSTEGAALISNIMVPDS